MMLLSKIKYVWFDMLTMFFKKLKKKKLISKLYGEII